MSRIKHLQLVLPQTLAQLRATDAQDQYPLLRQWLTQGERQRLWGADDLQHARLDPWQHSLLHGFSPVLRAQGLASGMLQWRGEGGAWRNGTCLQVELVHLQAGMDDLRLLLPPAPTIEEAALLLTSLQPLLSLSGYELLSTPAAQSGQWYLHSEQPLELITYSPRAGFATRVFDIMPQGKDGARLRRLMTEAQMILHEHPVNQQRARRGVPGLNALWCWGAAPLDLVAEQALQRVLSNHAYVRGLCEHLHLECWPLPPDAQALLTVDANQQLLVLPELPLATLETAWLQPLQVALLCGDIEQLDIHLDHWRMTLHGGRWAHIKRRMRQRPATLSELLA